MSDLLILHRLLLITIIAGAIGYERERHGRAAGFRTHILVGIGSCLTMLTGLILGTDPAWASHVDPTRIAAQVISGIGFLGAGTILRFRASIRGLTTAASLWAVGGIGIAIGAGLLRAGILTGLIVILVLFGFSPLERAMRKTWYQTLIVETTGSGSALVNIRGLLGDYDIEIRDLEISEGAQSGRLHLQFYVKLLPDQPREEIVSKLLRLEGTVDARWA